MNKIFSKVFLWMFVGLLVTFGVAAYISTQKTMMYNLFSGSKYLIICLIEIIVVIVLSARIHKLSTMTAKILFLLYSFLTGVTISSIFVVYELQSIIFVFLIAALVFLLFGLIGYFTKMDITKLGSILFMALIASLACVIINMFVQSEAFNLGLNILCLVVFLGYVAYDIQIIKRNMYMIEDEDKAAIHGALQLYIDFINIFLRLLQLFGKNSD